MDEDKKVVETAAAAETVKRLGEKLGIVATLVDGYVKVIVPEHMSTDGVLNAVAGVAAEVNKEFGTRSYVTKRSEPKENPSVTATVTPQSGFHANPMDHISASEPAYTGRLAKVPPAFLEIIVKAILSICAEVSVEAVAATDKHGLLHSPHEGWAVIKEELEELFDEVRDNAGKKDSARHEAIQVAATAVKYVLMLGPPFGSARVPEKHWEVALDIAKYTE